MRVLVDTNILHRVETDCEQPSSSRREGVRRPVGCDYERLRGTESFDVQCGGFRAISDCPGDSASVVAVESVRVVLGKPVNAPSVPGPSAKGTYCK